jgi:hypothetical protein
MTDLPVLGVAAHRGSLQREEGSAITFVAEWDTAEWERILCEVGDDRVEGLRLRLYEREARDADGASGRVSLTGA